MASLFAVEAPDDVEVPADADGLDDSEEVSLLDVAAFSGLVAAGERRESVT
ncbi:MAG: hypothetical protein WAJ94_02845 [Candidatus Cybelea sp.]